VVAEAAAAAVVVAVGAEAGAEEEAVEVVVAAAAAGNPPCSDSPTFEGRKKPWGYTLMEKEEVHGSNDAGRSSWLPHLLPCCFLARLMGRP
jgi:hypothetical protein